MSHLDTARYIGHRHASHMLGYCAAMEKVGQGGLLRQLGRAAKGAYEGLSPAAQSGARRMAGGAAVGGLTGGVLDTPGGMLGGMAAGAGLGLGGHKALQYAKNYGTTAGAKQLNLFDAAAAKARQQAAGMEAAGSQMNLF